MKKKIFYLFAITPFLFSCNLGKNQPEEKESDGPKAELVIPTVDVKTLNIDLPNKPVREYKQEDIRNDANYYYIDIYETSDFHGAVNYNYDADDHCIDTIGLGKMASYFESRRNYNKGGTVIISSGDMFQGSAESNLTRGYSVNYCMNYMGFDSMTVGNHEFDWGDEWLKANSELSYNGDTIPFLCANLIDKRTNEIPSFVQPSTVIQRGEFKIGIVGTIGENLESSILKSSIENYEFLPEANIVKAEASRLKNEENCDVVIWSSHNGAENLITSGVTKADVDAVFGGHAHQNFVDSTTVSGVPFLATKNYGKGIAYASLKISKVNKEVTFDKCYWIDTTSTNIVDFDTYQENQGIKTILSQYNDSIDTIKNIRLGHTEKELSNSSIGTLKNICVSAMQKSTAKLLDQLGGSAPCNKDDLIIAYHNVSGGIRSSIGKGEIKYGDVYKPFPFDNEIVLYKMTGSEVLSSINRGFFSNFAVWHSFIEKSEVVIDKEYYVMSTDFLTGRDGISDDKLYHTGLIVRDEVARLIYEEDEIDSSKYKSKGNFSTLGVL